MTQSLAAWVAGSENERCVENLLYFLLQEDDFRRKFARWLGYTAKITSVGKQRRDSNQRQDLVLNREKGGPINIELKGCSGFTPEQRRALNREQNTPIIHCVICPQSRKEALLRDIVDHRSTRIKTWAGLVRSFKKTNYRLFLEGIEQYFLSGETLAKKQLEEDVRQYRGDGPDRTWYETYAFINHLTSLMIAKTEKTYTGGWSYAENTIGRYLYRKHKKERAYLFVGFFFEDDQDISFFVETNRGMVAGKDLEVGERAWGKVLWTNNADSSEHLSAEGYCSELSNVVQRLEEWRGEE